MKNTIINVNRIVKNANKRGLERYTDRLKIHRRVEIAAMKILARDYVPRVNCMEKIDGACHSANVGWLSQCVSGTRPTRASAGLTYHSIFKKNSFHSYSTLKNTKKITMIFINQAASVMFESRSYAMCSRVARRFKSEWGGRLVGARQPASRRCLTSLPPLWRSLPAMVEISSFPSEGRRI